jgi:hypothetical protein
MVVRTRPLMRRVHLTNYYVDLLPLCFSFGAAFGVVRVAAPVAKWTVGKLAEDVIKYYRKRGAEVGELGVETEWWHEQFQN